MPKGNQKDAYYFPHDCNARNDPKILALRSVFGAEGYGVYWMMIEILREQPNYKLRITKYLYDTLAMQMQISKERLQEIIEACCNEFVEGDSPLLMSDGQYIYSESLRRRMERVDTVSAARRTAARKRWEAGPCKVPESEAGWGTECNSNANAKQKQSKENKRKSNQKITPPISPSLSSAVREQLKRINLNISSRATGELATYETTMGTEVCLRAIDIAVDSGKPTWLYINGILRRWSAEGVKCTADIETLDLQHEQQKRSGMKYHPGAGATVPQPGKLGLSKDLERQDRERLKEYLAKLKAEDETMEIEF